jgi:hypothetical protein
VVGVSEVVALESISAPSKIKQLPSGVKLPCYTSEYWKKIISYYTNAQVYKYCTEYIKEEAVVMGERLDVLSDALDKTEKDLKSTNFKCANNIPDLKKDLAAMKSAYESCKLESNINVKPDGSIKFKNSKLDPTSEFFIKCLTEFKEFQSAAQHFRMKVSEMLNNVRAIRKVHKEEIQANKQTIGKKENKKTDEPTPESDRTNDGTSDLTESKIIKTDLSTLEGSTLDLLDISDNTISNILALVSALHEFSAETRYTGDVKKRKDSLYANQSKK